MEMSRTWAMPDKDTFSIKPIGDFVKKHLRESKISVDPFARNKDWATHTNDLSTETSAQYHMDAEDFCLMLKEKNIQADLAIFDPPYSPRQVSECYKSVGIKVGMKETQTGSMYKRVRNALDGIVKPGGIVLSFGWNSVGMGINRNYEIIEIMLCCHGGPHHDTICVSEKKRDLEKELEWLK